MSHASHEPSAAHYRNCTDAHARAGALIAGRRKAFASVHGSVKSEANAGLSLSLYGRNMTMKNTRLLLTLIGLCFVLPLGSGSLAQGTARTIEIHVHRFAFEPSEITVKKGETVHLILISDDVPHSLLVSDLGINVPAKKSHPGQATLTAKNTGDFHGRCGTFCGSGHGRMLFTVHVTGD